MTSPIISTNTIKLYVLFSEIYYDQLCKEYYNILTLNKQPYGELNKYTKLISITNPSTKQNTLINKHCTYAISNNLLLNNDMQTNYSCSNLLTVEHINELTEFLLNNNYIIDTSITKIFKNSNSKSSNNYFDAKKLIYSFKITL